MADSAADLAVRAALDRATDAIRRQIQDGREPQYYTEAQPVEEVLKSHPVFYDTSSRFFAGKQLLLGPQWQRGNLLKVATEHDSERALKWLYKVYSSQEADIRYVAEVYGLTTERRITLSNGVTLHSFEELPTSRNSRLLAEQLHAAHVPPFRPYELPIVAALEVPGVKATRTGKNYRSATLEHSVMAFTLAEDTTPVVGQSWIDFVDSDLRCAGIGLVGVGSRFEGPVPQIAQEIDARAVEWVEKYLHLHAEVKHICDVALERLNLGRRRRSPGNRAIEGAICLEALLGDKDTGDLTYKLTLRGALLLEHDLAKRRQVKKALGEFYALRSRAVHGKAMTEDDPKLHSCADQGLELCHRALKKIVEQNKMPEPAEWELSGGA